METQKLTSGKIKVNQLEKSDQELAYANHIEQFKNSNVKPDIKENFLNEKVFGLFSFAESKEGHRYWFDVLEKIAIKENKKQEYLKEKKSLSYNKDLVLFICYCIISFIVFFFLLLFIFNK